MERLTPITSEMLKKTWSKAAAGKDKVIIMGYEIFKKQTIIKDKKDGLYKVLSLSASNNVRPRHYEYWILGIKGKTLEELYLKLMFEAWDPNYGLDKHFLKLRSDVDSVSSLNGVLKRKKVQEMDSRDLVQHESELKESVTVDHFQGDIYKIYFKGYSVDFESPFKLNMTYQENSDAVELMHEKIKEVKKMAGDDTLTFTDTGIVYKYIKMVNYIMENNIPVVWNTNHSSYYELVKSFI